MCSSDLKSCLLVFGVVCSHLPSVLPGILADVSTGVLIPTRVKCHIFLEEDYTAWMSTLEVESDASGPTGPRLEFSIPAFEADGRLAVLNDHGCDPFAAG